MTYGDDLEAADAMRAMLCFDIIYVVNIKIFKLIKTSLASR